MPDISNGFKAEHAVRLSGLPFRVTEEELSQFLSEGGCDLPDGRSIVIILNKDGNPSGMAYALMSTQDDAQKACDLSGQNILHYGRYANISECDPDEVLWNLNRAEASENLNGLYYRVRVGNLPFRLGSDYELVKWFQPEASAQEIEILLNSQGRSTGEAILYFSDGSHVDACMAKDGCDFNGRQIRVELENDSLSEPIPRRGCFVTMKGIPFRATRSELINFFDNLKCLSVRVVINSSGRSSGEAIAEFGSEEEVDEAIDTKNKETIDGRFVVLTRDPPTPEGSMDSSSRGGGRGRGESRGSRGYRGGEMSSRGGRGGGDFSSGGRGGGDFSSGGRGGSRGGGRGGRGGSDMESTSPRGGGRGGSRGGYSSGGNDRNDDGFSMARGRGGGRGRGEGRGMGGGSRGGRGSFDGGYSRGGGRGGGGKNSVFMAGLPYTSREQDIFDFFSSVAKCVSAEVLMNDQGRPSGNARAEFGSRDEAEKAMNLNREYMGDRFVILKPEY